MATLVMALFQAPVMYFLDYQYAKVALARCRLGLKLCAYGCDNLFHIEIPLGESLYLQV